MTLPRRLAVAGLLATAVVGCHPDSGAAARPDASMVDLLAFPARVNPEMVGGLVLYMGGGEGCHAIPATVDVEGLMVAINKDCGTSCAPLADPAWRECPYGAVYAKPDRSGCVCRTSDKAPRQMTCPK